jgi:hypothetical protein
MGVLYPTFAWFWDNDRERLMKRIVDSEIISAIKRSGIKLDDVYDFENFYNVVVVRLRDGRNILCNKEI